MFRSTDALWEQYPGVSPYNYCGNNPVMLRDPTGMGWFGDFFKDTKDVVTGAFDAAASDLTGVDITTGDRSSTLYNASKTAGHVVIVLAGTTMAESGAGEIAAGVVLAPETGGASLAISGVGTIQVVVGTRLAGNAVGNLMKMQASNTGDAITGVRNGHLAGSTHPKTGVPFDKNGFPDFSKHLYQGGKNDVMIKPTGNRSKDFAAANKAAGYKKTPEGYTWHHHQETGRMQLVEEGVHKATGHTGGYSLWKVSQ